MEINPSEVTKILKEQIKNFGNKAEVSEVGQVLSVGDGIARIYGLNNVQAGEMVEFSDRHPHHQTYRLIMHQRHQKLSFQDYLLCFERNF